MVNNSPAMQETWVQSLGQEDPLEKEMAIHSSILACKIPWMEELKLQYFGHLMQYLTPWKRPWCWERLRPRGEGDKRGWDSWMASLTEWTWVWVNPRSWWQTGRPSVLQSTRLQRFGHDWATELSWFHADCLFLRHLIELQEVTLWKNSASRKTKEYVVGVHN